MGRNFDFQVDQCANNLNEQARHDDRGEEEGHAIEAHEEKKATIADDVDDIGHKSAFALAHLVAGPSVDGAIHADGDERKHPGEEDDNARKGKAVGVGQLIQIAKDQQKCDCHRGKVEGMEKP